MVRKIKTLVVIDNLYTGGVATSLYNYLYFAHELMDIHLLVFDKDSIDKTKVPDNVEIVTPDKGLHILGKNHSRIKQESFLMMIYRLIMIFIARNINGIVSRMILWPFVKRQSGYDLAIAYAQDDSYKSISKGCIDYIIKRVVAKHKSVIVHCDYKNFGGYDQRQINMFKKLNTIICVSDSCRNNFIECFPELRNKTIVCENFTNVNAIRKLAGNGVYYPTETINFVSVCRLSEVKGLSRTIEALGELRDNGIVNFTWTIVGNGPEYEKLNSIIKEKQLTSKITLVGKKENPYPYIKHASYFLLPSLHEAAPMVYGEAASLGVPVLSTETCSAIELVQEREIGVVVPNNYDGLLQGLRNIIMNTNSIHIKKNMDLNKFAMIQLKNFIESIKN